MQVHLLDTEKCFCQVQQKPGQQNENSYNIFMYIIFTCVLSDEYFYKVVYILARSGKKVVYKREKIKVPYVRFHNKINTFFVML